MATPTAEREQWGSRIGFVLAAAGSAIGLGNIWRFPFKTGENGGAAFVILYLACILFICLPYLFAELSLGRNSQKNPVGAIKAIKEKGPWSLVGGLCVLTGVFILSYYGVIAGWAFGYIFKDIVAPAVDASQYFSNFIANPIAVIPLLGLFMLLTIGVVVGGVEQGIERWAKVLMPVLLVLMLVVIFRSVTLPGAGAGLDFYLNPDFSKIDGGVIVEALGQAFFSLSLGMGAMITYGSYLPKRENLLVSGGYVALFDTAIALMAGLMIFPAVFAMGATPNEGPALIFVVLPQVFEAMPLGSFIGAVFFILLSIAALTSTVSLLEVVVSYFVDDTSFTRKKAAWLVGGFTFAFGVPSALANGAVGWLTDMSWLVSNDIVGQNPSFLDIMDFIWGNMSLGMGALLLSIFVGWVWGSENAIEELQQGSGDTFKGAITKSWSIFLKYICPIFILVILANIVGINLIEWVINLFS
ncbi:sodium-dependent transporter [Longibacter salinarum]|uniref:Transporter n=1 Tax=Longibacter salinarum TaxID=1850348 RepID=A0A2A8CWL7_9BACT|nr:sodium-dependent transporter [Longibacter salinarum]PEN13092.1 sodium-dependent transporter [Longibacter salinarum]